MAGADQATQVPVVIVGAGPAGLVTAVTLARNGIRSLLVERNPGLSPLPRATAVSTRTMELLRSWGLEDEVRDGQLQLAAVGGWATETLASPNGTLMPLGIADLQRSAAVLSAHTPDGPCDERCGCISDPGERVPTAVVLSAKPGAGVEEPPIACTLNGGDMGQRLDDWQDLLTHVTARTPVDDGIRLTFAPDVPLDRVAALAAAEQDCCRFFRFALTVDTRGTALEVRAPADAHDLLGALFGAPT